ncbi:hypothetical protein ABKN59_000891 [Abortiporus biennis]
MVLFLDSPTCIIPAHISDGGDVGGNTLGTRAYVALENTYTKFKCPSFNNIKSIPILLPRVVVPIQVFAIAQDKKLGDT